MAIDLRLPDPERAAQDAVAFIREQIEGAEREKAVIALSGGLDSSVVAMLAVQALGPDRVASHTLPDEESTPPEDVEDAEELARTLGIHCRRISIHAAHEALEATFQTAGLRGDQVAWGNVKARLRMIINYFVASFEKGLVLGTGNKSEVLVGYYTKFGDGGVDLLPVGHLYKTQVRQLARHLGAPSHVVQKPPSAGLWKGQTDEEELGASYQEIDGMLHCLHDRNMSVEEAAHALNMERSRVERVADLMRRSAHKRRLPPTPGSP